ncbi:MAG: universal stress protein [Alphaproteobacteria bacterium]|nr:MAG: universal stress protein [Alphaproteobacteria bacterium]
MNDDTTPGNPLSRILVVLDPSAETRSLLDYAAELAAELGVPLVGVFVEDTDIAEFAELPFAREICISAGTVRALSRQRMQSYFRAEAARLRRALEAAGRARRISCSFELRRGRVETELAAIVQDRDLIAIAPGFGTVVRARDHDILGRLSGSAAAGFLAFSQRRVVRDGILAVFTGSPESERAVALGATIAGRRGVPLRVVVAGPALEPAMGEAVQRLARGVDRVEVMAGEGRVADMLRTLVPPPQMVVLPADLSGDELKRIRKLDLPLLVIRRT